MGFRIFQWWTPWFPYVSIHIQRLRDVRPTSMTRDLIHVRTQLKAIIQRLWPITRQTTTKSRTRVKLLWYRKGDRKHQVRRKFCRIYKLVGHLRSQVLSNVATSSSINHVMRYPSYFYLIFQNIQSHQSFFTFFFFSMLIYLYNWCISYFKIMINFIYIFTLFFMKNCEWLFFIFTWIY